MLYDHYTKKGKRPLELAQAEQIPDGEIDAILFYTIMDDELDLVSVLKVLGLGSVEHVHCLLGNEWPDENITLLHVYHSPIFANADSV
jgi:hypothetical protein